MQKSRPEDANIMFNEAKTGKTGFRPFTEEERRVNLVTAFPQTWEMYKHQTWGFVAGEPRRGNQVTVIVRSPTGSIYRTLTAACEALVPAEQLPKRSRRAAATEAALRMGERNYDDSQGFSEGTERKEGWGEERSEERTEERTEE
jgi:hypothetical protein